MQVSYQTVIPLFLADSKGVCLSAAQVVLLTYQSSVTLFSY